MTTNQILSLDYREEENKKIIQKVLRQIKPLSRYSDEEEIPIEALEIAITVMCKKYDIRIKDISPDIWSADKRIIWRACIISDKNLAMRGNVYGISMYEVLAKSTVKLYSDVRLGIAKVREDY